MHGAHQVIEQHSPCPTLVKRLGHLCVAAPASVYLRELYTITAAPIPFETDLVEQRIHVELHVELLHRDGCYVLLERGCHVKLLGSTLVASRSCCRRFCSGTARPTTEGQLPTGQQRATSTAAVATHGACRFGSGSPGPGKMRSTRRPRGRSISSRLHRACSWPSESQGPCR